MCLKFYKFWDAKDRLEAKKARTEREGEILDLQIEIREKEKLNQEKRKKLKA